jgi:hypothetical protein
MRVCIFFLVVCCVSHAHLGRKFGGIRRIREIFSGGDSLFDNSMSLRTNSVSLVSPVSPVDKISLVDETRPVSQVSPIHSIHPIYPIHPIHPIHPIYPIDRISPIYQISPIYPIIPIDPISPIDPIDLIHPVYPARSHSACNDQVGLDAMMDRFLSIQRLPDPSHYRE